MGMGGGNVARKGAVKNEKLAFGFRSTVKRPCHQVWVAVSVCVSARVKDHSEIVATCCVVHTGTCHADLLVGAGFEIRKDLDDTGASSGVFGVCAVGQPHVVEHS